MGVRHVVLFSFDPQADDNMVDGIISQLNQLPKLIPEIKSWSIHKDQGNREQSFTYALIATFNDMAAVERYLNHPAHVQVVNQALPVMRRLAEHDHAVAF
jgi:hypothetical protein